MIAFLRTADFDTMVFLLAATAYLCSAAWQKVMKP